MEIEDLTGSGFSFNDPNAFSLPEDKKRLNEREKRLQRRLIKSTKKFLVRLCNEDDYFILEGFGLDTVIFAKIRGKPVIKFLELKVSGGRNGGIGIGNGNGEGRQIDILMKNKEQLKLMDRYVRWIVQDKGSYYFFDTIAAKTYVIGKGVGRGKQNNLNVKQIRDNEKKDTWEELSAEIGNFISK